MTDPIRLSFASPIGDAPVYHLPETDSTMDDAARLAASGEKSGFIVWTDFQSAGRGRRAGRVWHAERGSSLMFTVAVRKPAAVATASLRAGVAVARALEGHCGLSPRIKWPNDVMVDDRKISGVLCDLRGEWLYTGVGVNLTQGEFPDELRDSATSVSMAGGMLPDRPGLLRAIVRGLDGSPGDWHEALAERLWCLGERVTVGVINGTPLRGVLEGVDPDGCLVVNDGIRPVRVAAGEFTRDEHHDEDN